MTSLDISYARDYLKQRIKEVGDSPNFGKKVFENALKLFNKEDIKETEKKKKENGITIIKCPSCKKILDVSINESVVFNYSYCPYCGQHVGTY